MLLAGDIGGTKTNLGIYSHERGSRRPLAEATFSSARYPSLETLVQEFLKQASVVVDHASFGVAGPVLAGEASITNLPWVIHKKHLKDLLKLKSVHLLNDLEAIACGVPLLEQDDVHTLNKGIPIPQGTIAVIAPGTGLGEAFLVWDGFRYRAHASEGGHCDFGPTSDLEIGLLQYLLERFEHVSYERVCSGKGFFHIYCYLKDSGYAEEPGWLAEQLAAAEDPAPVIVNAALKGDVPCKLCDITLTVFTSVLGSEAGNLALKVFSTGGLYLGGGIPPRIVSVLDKGFFMKRFTGKGRFSKLLSRIPVHVILNPKIALMGAAEQGLTRSQT